jgi:hypothetical protein
VRCCPSGWLASWLVKTWVLAESRVVVMADCWKGVSVFMSAWALGTPMSETKDKENLRDDSEVHVGCLEVTQNSGHRERVVVFHASAESLRVSNLTHSSLDG